MHRLAQAHDLPFIYELYMHPQVNQHLLYEQMTIDEFRLIYEDLLNDEIKYIFEDNTTAVGMFKLVPLKHRCDHIVYLGGLAIHPDFGGKGYGLKMMKAIIELAKSKGIKRIELSAGTNNLRAIDLYKKVGFQEEGILRKYTHLKSEGYFLDEMLMSCILE